MYECERLFGSKRGREIHKWVESAIGHSCPCVLGDPCPIVPGAVLIPAASLFVRPEPISRVS